MVDGFPILSIIIFLPLVGASVVLITPGADDVSSENIKSLAVITTCFTFIFSLSVLFWFDISNAGYQFVETVAWAGSGIQYKVGVDGISILFLILTTFIVPIAVVSGWKTIRHRMREYIFAILVLETTFLGLLCAVDLVLFFVFLAGAIFPLYYLIGIWGKGNAEAASTKLISFLSVSAASLLIVIVLLYSDAGTTDLVELKAHSLSHTTTTYGWPLLFLAFCLLAPIWPFHRWFVDAVASAPTSCSILLSSLVMNVAGYGFLRVALPLFPQGAIEFEGILVGLSAITMIVSVLAALVEKDIKRLIAYMCVAHMGLIILSIFTATQTGVLAALLHMVSFSLVATGLFLSAGLLEERVSSTDLKAFGGLTVRMPLFAFAFLIAILAAIGVPGTSGFVAQFSALVAVYNANGGIIVFVAVLLFLSALIGIRLYKTVFLGPLEKEGFKDVADLNTREKYALFPILALIIFAGIFPNSVWSIAQTAVLDLTERPVSRDYSPQTFAVPGDGSQAVKSGP